MNGIMSSFIKRIIAMREKLTKKIMKNDVDNMKSEKYLLIKSHASFKE